jgi:hypothetical protein
VERDSALEALARLLELDVATHQRDEVDALQDLVDGVLGDGHGRVTVQSSPPR